MKIKIAENIKKYRKERGLTQERLAEVLGVTVGAVSKWEAGASVPDISLILMMAELFRTSVDVLLGYGWERGSMGETIAHIRELRNEKRFDEATSEAERAIERYPNSFNLIYQSAILYSVRGVEEHCDKSYRRALTLFERSLELISQNTDSQISEWTIQNHISDIYLCLGKIDRALELMKKNNMDGLRNGDIGYTIALNNGDPDEALTYLSEAMLSHVIELMRVVIGYANAYTRKSDNYSAITIMEWMTTIVNGLRPNDKTCYFDNTAAQLYTGCAMLAAEYGDEAAVEDYLRRAKSAAVKFDGQPDYGFTNTKFRHGDNPTTGFDDFGSTAIAGIEKRIAEDEKVSALLEKIWRKINEQSTEK